MSGATQILRMVNRLVRAPLSTKRHDYFHHNIVTADQGETKCNTDAGNRCQLVKLKCYRTIPSSSSRHRPTLIECTK